MAFEYGIKYVMGRVCDASRKGTADKEVGKQGCSFVSCDPLEENKSQYWGGILGSVLRSFQKYHSSQFEPFSSSVGKS